MDAESRAASLRALKRASVNRSEAAASGQRRLTVCRPALSQGNMTHFFAVEGETLFDHFFSITSFQGLEVFRIDPTGPGLDRRWRGTTPTVTYPYDGPCGDGASCMINIEWFAPNRAYFNLELEALDGGEERTTEIKFDGNQLRCYGGWAVEDSTTVATTVGSGAWFKLDAVVEDAVDARSWTPAPRLLLRVDGQLVYAMPLATRVRLRGVVLKGWGDRPGRTYYARLAITDSVACAAARLVSLWLLRRANSDVALVVLAFAVPAPLLDLVRANSTALRGKRQVPPDRGGPLPTLVQGRLHFAHDGSAAPPPPPATWHATGFGIGIGEPLTWDDWDQTWESSDSEGEFAFDY